MATGLGFCPSCGTAKTEAGQRFCATCGATFAAVPAAATAAATAMPVPPSPAPTYAAAPPPPAYVPPPPPPTYVAAAPPAWGAQPVAPAAAPAKAAVSPVMLLVGGLVILAIVGVAFYMMNNNSAPGSLVFSPTTVNCGQTYTTTIRLPSSVKGTDQITLQDNGAVVATQTVSDAGLKQQPDGSWSASDTSPADCSIGAGAHTERLLDASGKVLAQGSFTLVGSSGPTPTAGAGTPAPATQAPTQAPTEAATQAPTQAPTEAPTQAPTQAPSMSSAGSSTTIDPSSFSCSAADQQIVLTIRLSASIPGTAEVTSEIDGNTGDTSTVSAGFEKQADGSWLSSAPESSQTLCEDLGTGKHSIGALDANGQVITQGTFTINP